MWFADNERYGLVKLEDPRLILDFYNKAQVPEIPKTEIHLEVKDEDVDKIVKNVLTTSFNKILDSNNKAESFIQKAVSHIQNKNYTKWDLLFLCEKILYEKVALNSNFKDMKDTINNWASVETFIFDIVTWIFKDADWKVRYDMPDSFKERFKKYILKGKENKDNGYLYDFQAIVEGCYSIRKINNFDVDINKLAVNMLNDLNNFEDEFANLL